MIERTTLVIGGGAAGVMLSRELLRHTDDRIILVDPAAEPGRGPAYSAASPWHLLNSPAATMSVENQDPGHFVEWSRSVGVAVEPADFAPRLHYGDYLHAMLAQAVATGGGRLRLIRAQVDRISRHHDALTAVLDNGQAITADDVVVATGNPASADPMTISTDVRDHPGYIASPWLPGALDGMPSTGPVLLVGTGLTAVDVALNLFESNPAAKVVAASRHGLIPQRHRDRNETPAVHAVPPGPGLSVAAMLSAIRESVARVGDWRAVVDGMRPRLDEIWQAWSQPEQQRFITHLARYWEIHRHRMAPRIARRIAALRESGGLEIRAARIAAVAVGGPDRLDVTFDSGERAVFAAVVNCTGPGRLPYEANPLVAGLMRDGLARLGPHRLGLDVRDDGRLVDTAGDSDAPLWIIGALRRGRFWETTAVPEIRDQAVRLARRISALGSPANAAV